MEENSTKTEIMKVFNTIHDVVDSALQPFGAISDEALD